MEGPQSGHGTPDLSRLGTEEFDEFGISITNLRANLRLTPLERIQRASAFAGMILRLRKGLVRKPKI